MDNPVVPSEHSQSQKKICEKVINELKFKTEQKEPFPNSAYSF